MTTGHRLTVDSERCSGHGRCFSLEPELFDCDDEGYPLVLHEELPEALEGNADNAIGSCPEVAIARSPRE